LGQKDNTRYKKMNLLLAITGGIAAYKIPRLVSLLVSEGHQVRIIATENGLRFVSPLTLTALSGHLVLSDMWGPPPLIPVKMENAEVSAARQEQQTEGFDETTSTMGHIRLPEWADLLVVAPASANIIAKAAHGIADDLVSTLLCATGTGVHGACPVVYVPAMNSRMWTHAATQGNLNLLRSWGAYVIEPEAGRLACSDYGEGRMPEPETILQQLKEWGLFSTPKSSQ
jgi:phosphopantothenoylcysteine decarboxylase/phosphopantothenate--cysteine ligase